MRERRLFLWPAIGVVAVLLIALLASCGGGETTTDNNEDSTVVESEPITPETIKEYPIPTPFEVTKMLNTAGASYIVDVLNSNQNVYKYETEKKQSLNLGVYGADLSYASTYNKTQETMQYVSSSQELANKLGINSALTQDVVDKIAENQDNQEALYDIITKTFTTTFEELNQNGRGNVSALVLAGGWIEGLYISTQLAQTAMNRDAVLKGIAEQKPTLATLIATLKTFQNDASVGEVLADLERISAAMVDVSESVTDAQLEGLTSVVEEIRAKVIE